MLRLRVNFSFNISLPLSLYILVVVWQEALVFGRGESDTDLFDAGETGCTHAQKRAMNMGDRR